MLVIQTKHLFAIRYLKSKYRSSDMKNNIVSHLKFTVKDACLHYEVVTVSSYGAISACAASMYPTLVIAKLIRPHKM